jgi:ATP-binding protein involved in chromosome partitioning
MGSTEDAQSGPEPTPQRGVPTPQNVPGVGRVLAVSSGKGGVGKSTVATNLAVALAALGHKVGLMDADVYGPDIPIMFGVHSRPRVTTNERIVPLEAHGVKLMSIGFLLDDETPAIWRGPIVMGIIRQFLQQVDWGELDYLLVDMPPGTGDAQLSLVQLAKVDGALMVTTPQGVATGDVLKGIKMFERVEVPVIGLIENMSGFVCPHCGESTDVFGSGGGRRLAAIADVPFLGPVPLGAAVVAASDSGRPTVVSDPGSPEAQAFVELAGKIVAAVGTSGEHAGASPS